MSVAKMAEEYWAMSSYGGAIVAQGSVFCVLTPKVFLSVCSQVFIPPGGGCRPEVCHVTNSLGFVWGLFRVCLVFIQGFIQGFQFFFFPTVLIRFYCQGLYTLGFISDLGFRAQDLETNLVSHSTIPPGTPVLAVFILQWNKNTHVDRDFGIKV